MFQGPEKTGSSPSLLPSPLGPGKAVNHDHTPQIRTYTWLGVLPIQVGEKTRQQVPDIRQRTLGKTCFLWFALGSGAREVRLPSDLGSYVWEILSRPQGIREKMGNTPSAFS